MTGLWIDFKPSQTANFATDFGSLFSLFRVLSADVVWHPAATQLPLTNALTFTLQPMLTAFNPVDNTVPAASSTMYQEDDMQIHNLLVPWRHRYFPKYLGSLSAGNDVLSSSKAWLSIASDPSCYGLKVFIPNCGNAGATVVGQFLVTIRFSLRDTA